MSDNNDDSKTVQDQLKKYKPKKKKLTVPKEFLDNANSYDDKLIDLPVYARLKGTESEKAKAMLEGTRTKMFTSVEEAINSAVMGVKN